MRRAQEKPKATLVFGEDDSDCDAIRELVMALRPDLPPPAKRRKPLVLVKGRAEAMARKNGCEIASVVAAAGVTNRVVAVFAHQDADDVEDAHEALASAIERTLADAKVPDPVGVVPAWEIESWWFLWPAAVAAVHSRWAPLARTGRVGLIEHAKERLKQDLRPKKKLEKARDFVESDGPRVAAKVRELGIVDATVATSESWLRFSRRVRSLRG